MLFGSQVYRQRPSLSSIRGAAFLDPCCTKPADFVAPLSAHCGSSLSRLLTWVLSRLLLFLRLCLCSFPCPLCLLPSAFYSACILPLPLCCSESDTHVANNIDNCQRFAGVSVTHTRTHSRTLTHALHDTLSLKAKLSSALSTVRQAAPWQQCDV